MIQQQPNSSGADFVKGDPFAASWLHSNYEDHLWVVSDSFDSSKQQSIDFRVCLPDGRCLTEAPEYYKTIKSYAWWVRSDRFTSIDSSETHANTVRMLIFLAHRLCLDNVRTFSHLLPSHIAAIVEDSAFGVDAVVRASERLEAYIETVRSMPSNERASLADRIKANYLWAKDRVSSIKVLDICNLPRALHTSGRTAFRVNKIAELVGITKTSKSVDTQLRLTSREAIQRFLTPLERLYEMRAVIEGGGLDYNPFPEGLGTIAAVKGIDSKRTPLVPPNMMLEMLETAVQCVADFKSSRSEAVEEKIVTACWVLIAAFTARRYEEILGLEDDCIKGGAAGGWYIECYISKTLQHLHLIPVPHLVVSAIKILIDLSANARSVSGSSEIFLKLNKDGRTVSRSFTPQRLDRFAQEHGVSLPVASTDDDGKMWHWRPHEFRRFFAVLYFYRFEGARLEALSHHLRHYNIEMTRRYVTSDVEGRAIWANEQWGYQGWISRQIVANNRSVTGALAEELKGALKERTDFFRRKLMVVSPHDIVSSLTLIMREKGLVLTPKPWVLCSCPLTKAAGAIAACRRASGALFEEGPDFAYAGHEACSGCPHALKVDRTFESASIELEEVNAFLDFEPGASTVVSTLQESRAFSLRRITKINGTSLGVDA